jgi:hypothetical protein
VKFKVADDVEAPVDWVWAGFTDFAAIEADIRAREADLSRVGDWKEAALGVAWRGSVPVRGKHRTIDARIAGFVPEERLLVESQIGGMACTYEVTFAPLAGGSTRVSVILELKASTLSARLLLADAQDRAAQGDPAARRCCRAAGAGGGGRLARTGRGLSVTAG